MHSEALEQLRVSSPPNSLQLPVWDLPSFHSLRPEVLFSVVAQIDALLFTLRGVRLECDVCAAPGVESFNLFKGWTRGRSLSTVCGLYWADMSLMPTTVAVAKSHHACGAFVVDARGEADVPATIDGVSWLEVLKGASLVVFEIPGGLSVFFAAFAYIGKFKSKRRPERLFKIAPVPRVDGLAHQLGVVPVSLTRSSPLAAASAPSSELDSCAATPRLVVPLSQPSPTPPSRSIWDLDVFRAWARHYPDKEVMELALQAVDGGVDP